MNSCTGIAFLVLVVFAILLLCYNCSSFGSGPDRVLNQIPMLTETGVNGGGYDYRAYNGLYDRQGPTETSPTSTIFDSGNIHGMRPTNVQTNANIPTIIGPLNERFSNNNIIHRHQGDNGRVPLNQWDVPLFANPALNQGTLYADSADSSPFMPGDCTAGMHGIADPNLTGGPIIPRNIDMYNNSPNCFSALNQVVMPIEGFAGLKKNE
jgi:hypothetical protein